MATQKLDVLHTVLLQLREILKLHTLLYSIYRKFLAVILEFFNSGKMSKAGKVGPIYLIKKRSAAKRTVYWIWPLFLVTEIVKVTVSANRAMSAALFVDKYDRL